jgi:hypothetical protein
MRRSNPLRLSFARDGRDAADGGSTLRIASVAVQPAANPFLSPAFALYCGRQFRAAMLKRACRAEGEGVVAPPRSSVSPQATEADLVNSTVLLTLKDHKKRVLLCVRALIAWFIC